jgi:hypothetical protein
MTHTPGLWGVLRGKESVVVYTPFRGSEDELSSFISLHNAAPDMLRALEAVCGDSEESDYLTQAQIQAMCRSAIQKARGEE